MKKNSSTAGNSAYIALLRGINVGGHKIVKMDQLRKALEALKFEDVKTYVQSGNIVFKAPAQPVEALERKIEKKVLHQFGFPVPVIVRSSKQLGDVIKKNRFPEIETSKIYVSFLSSVPESASVKRLDASKVVPDQFQYCGQEIYLYLPNGFAGAKLSVNAFEKVLSVSATTRNWNTVTRLYEMSLG
jgi:uncharacterized protein (DUF1697 family)